MPDLRSGSATDDDAMPSMTPNEGAEALGLYSYPKVPRYGLPFVEDAFWEGTLIATEKVDGSLFRFTMYDKRYEDAYGSAVRGFAPNDGDIIAGTANEVQWRITPNGRVISPSTPTTYAEPVNLLGEVDRDALYELHDEEDGPCVLFAEAMVGHLTEYDADTPSLLGFDVFATARGHGKTSTPPAAKDTHPYDRRWDGFLAVERAMETFDRIGLHPTTPAETLPTVDADAIDPETLVIPNSRYGDVQAEGVVFHNPRTKQRVKVRSDAFMEVKHHHKEKETGEDASGADRFIGTYCTPIRIMKTVEKMVQEEGRELSTSLIPDASDRVYDDIWQEEWRTIKEADYTLNIPEVRDRVTRKTASIVSKMAEGEISLTPGMVGQDELQFRFRD